MWYTLSSVIIRRDPLARSPKTLHKLAAADPSGHDPFFARDDRTAAVLRPVNLQGVCGVCRVGRVVPEEQAVPLAGSRLQDLVLVLFVTVPGDGALVVGHVDAGHVSLGGVRAGEGRVAALLGRVQDDDERGDPVSARGPAAIWAAGRSAGALQEIYTRRGHWHVLQGALAVVVVGLVLLPLLVVEHVHALAKLPRNADESVYALLDHGHEVVMWGPHAERGPRVARLVVV
mmetsp:Transcript_800/g.2147  ORF Transcript_800/g.2147 Transcript_800/m.2147 type:complete len:231 (+) Transcript_800:662-1354(+)